MDKLTIEDVDFILQRKENFPIVWQIAKQLADTMRENDRLKASIIEVRDMIDAKEYIIADCALDVALHPNKDSDNVK